MTDRLKGKYLGMPSEKMWNAAQAEIERQTKIGAGLATQLRKSIEAGSRLSNALALARPYVKPVHGGDVQADADLRAIDAALAQAEPASAASALIIAAEFIASEPELFPGVPWSELSNTAKLVASLTAQLISWKIEEQIGGDK